MKQQRQVYIEAGRKKLGQMSDLLKEYVHTQEAGIVEAFKRYFHSVKGTAQTFQLMELGAVGMRYEHQLHELPDQSQQQKAIDIMAEGLQAIARSLEKYETDMPLGSEQEAGLAGSVDSTPCKARILAMDDDQTLLELVRVILLKEGYDARITTDFEKALEILNQFKPDLFLVDYHMADMSGLDVLAQIRDRGVPTPVVMLTGDPSEALREKLLTSGALGLISKPFKPPALMAQVKHFLEPLNP